MVSAVHFTLLFCYVIENYTALHYNLQFCSFICQVASARRQWSDLCGLRVKLPPAKLPEPEDPFGRQV